MNNEMTQLQERIFYYLVFGLGVVGLGGAVTSFLFGSVSSSWFLRSIALLVVALIALLLRRTGRFMIAAYVLVLEILGIIIGMLFQTDAPANFVPYLFAPLVIIAGLILSPTALAVIGLLIIALTLILSLQLSHLTLDILLPPLGLTTLTTLLMVVDTHYRHKLTNLLQKNRELLRDRTREMMEDRGKIETLQQRVVELQQQILQAQAKTEQSYHHVNQQNNKFYHIVQGTIRELDRSVKALERIVERIAETPLSNGRANLLTETWQKVDRLNNLAVNLQDLTLLAHDDVELNYQAVDIQSLISQVSSTAQHLIYDKNLELRTQVPRDLPTIQADPIRLRQALMYLVNNAIQYTDEGTVEIQAEASDEEVTIFVSDTGIGLPRKEMDLVFEEFGRSSSPAIQDRQGSGLGLTISKRLVELHQGRMWSTSTAGVGSTFYFAIPINPILDDATLISNVDEPTLVSMIYLDEPTLLSPALQPERPRRSIIEPVEQANHVQPAPVAAPIRNSEPNLPVSTPAPRLKTGSHLSPVARFSSTYISRFGLSLLGLLIIIAIAVALLAIFNQSAIDSGSVSLAGAEQPPLTSTAGSSTKTIPTASTDAGSSLVLTERLTETPHPSATSAPIQLPASTATLLSTIAPATATPLPSAQPQPPTMSPSPTTIPSPTATTPPALPSPSPTLSTTFAAEADPTIQPVNPPASAEAIVAPSRLSFATDNQIITQPNNEGQPTIVFSDLPESVENSRPSWSPSGQLLFTTEADGNREIYLREKPGGAVRNLSQHPADDHQAAWSPDGSKIAFSSGRGGNFNIYVMTAAGEDLTQLTTSRGFR